MNYSNPGLKILFFLVLSCCIISGCNKEKGCTYAGATNYDPSAEEEDGSCIIPGCTDPLSLNYNPNATEDDGSCQLAGLGGNTTIAAYPIHHGKTIFNQPGYPDTAYIKFNVQDFPGSDPALYDAVFSGTAGEDHVNIPGLKTGYYYIWMAGMDTAISMRVVGGIPVTLTQASGTVQLVIPVTE